MRGGPEGEKAVLDARCGTIAVLPGPAPKQNDKFPSNKTYYEIPIAVQDRSFNDDGSLFYPDSREFFDEIVARLHPRRRVLADLEPGVLRQHAHRERRHLAVSRSSSSAGTGFRFLNGCQSRFLILDFSAIPGVEVWQIGNEGGFLAAPVDVTGDHGGRILLGPAERADVIVDFANVPLGEHVLRNVGPDDPFGGGVPGRRLRARRP